MVCLAACPRILGQRQEHCSYSSTQSGDAPHMHDCQILSVLHACPTKLAHHGHTGMWSQEAAVVTRLTSSDPAAKSLQQSCRGQPGVHALQHMLHSWDHSVVLCCRLLGPLGGAGCNHSGCACCSRILKDCVQHIPAGPTVWQSQAPDMCHTREAALQRLMHPVSSPRRPHCS